MHEGLVLPLCGGMNKFRRRIQLEIITNKVGTKIETRKALQHSMALELRANAADHMLNAMHLRSHRRVSEDCKNNETTNKIQAVNHNENAMPEPS